MNSSSNIVTQVNEKDFVQLANLYGKIACSVELPYFNWNKESALQEIKKAESLVIVADGFIRAFITYRNYDDRFEISALGTDPGFLKKGYAQDLLETLKKCAIMQKKPIWLEVHAKNLKAVQLYQTREFVVVHRRKGYYSDLGDALVMTWTDGSS